MPDGSFWVEKSVSQYAFESCLELEAQEHLHLWANRKEFMSSVKAILALETIDELSTFLESQDVDEVRVEMLARYLVIEHYIYARFDGQLRGSLHVLAAVIEAEEDSIKWQPLEHAI
ncbi:hypothetical protein AB1L30_00150, partial [Bremerella sp. JC817]|uniref:hypothetical protein n=1 Tax=Bremerella sp. JC817 TaxID=3231756 RepID=UPI003459034A